MAISDSISALATSSAALSPTAAKSRDHLDQKSFLQLMIAQFRNQDPTKPKDPSEFLGQLAQFSTVSGIQEMQSSIESLSTSLRSQNVLGGAVMVGRDVMAPADSIAIGANETVTGAIEAPEGASTVDIEIKDNVGQLVRRMTVPVQSGLTASNLAFSWDGLTASGQPAGAGSYSISATARIGNTNESLSVLLNTRVDSVTIDPATQGLVLNTRGLGSISIDDVRRVM